VQGQGRDDEIEALGGEGQLLFVEDDARAGAAKKHGGRKIGFE
jgi:hypothetical protein